MPIAAALRTWKYAMNAMTIPEVKVTTSIFRPNLVLACIAKSIGSGALYKQS